MVRKGEHGLALWVPCGQRKDQNAQEGEQSSADADKPGFIMGTVFDVAQTDELQAAEAAPTKEEGRFVFGGFINNPEVAA